jgi:DNA primase
LEFLESTGLTIAREDRPFDRFKSRVMFPIQSMSGRVLGFGGRILTNDKKSAKYLNSPESDIYHKSKVLYGIYQAKQSIAKLNNCYLVEGYTDVIQFNQSGIENVVASSGTALTPDQIRLINRLTKNITVLFDGDAAGLRASIRGIDLILEEGMNVKVCTFPDGEDPDSFAKKSSHDDLVAYLEDNAKDFIQFKASLLMNEAKNDPIKKADLIRDMVSSISKIPDRIQREIYIQECSRIMDISEQVLVSTLAQLVQKDVAAPGKKPKQEYEQRSFEVIKNEDPEALEKVDVLGNVERELIRILLLYGNRTENFEEILMKSNGEGEIIEVTEFKEQKVFQKIFLSLQEDEVEFASPIFKVIYDDLINYYLQNENSGIEKYINHLQSGVPAEVTTIMMEDEKYVLHDWIGQNIFPKTIEDTLNQGVSDTLFTLRWFLISEIIENLKNSISNEPGSDNMESLSMVMSYIDLRVKFSRKLGRVVVRYH